MLVDSLNGFFHFNDVINKWGVNAAFMSLLAKVIISLSPAVQIILSVPFPLRTFPLQFRHICAVGEGLGGGGGASPPQMSQ